MMPGVIVSQGCPPKAMGHRVSCFCFLAAVVVALLLGSRVALAQTSGTLQGMVVDEQGGVVPGAALELVNEATSTTFRQTTGSQGGFVFNFVSPGRYVLSAQAPGFDDTEIQDLLVELNRSTVVTVRMRVAGIAEETVVVAPTAPVDTVSGQVSTNVETELVQDLPNLDRNVLAFGALAPGVQMSFFETSRDSGQVLNIQGSYAQVNGNRQGRNTFYLDGADNTLSFRNSAAQFPNPDAVQELQIATSNTPAEFGKQPGGSFNVITKSGTNRIDGTAAYFFRHKSLNANTWGNNQAGEPKAEDKLTNLSATLGGPIIRDRTFFFGSFMRFRDESESSQNDVRFPTEAMRQGDFSGIPVTLFNPDTGEALGHQIPAALIDPVAQNIAQSFPTVDAFDDTLFWRFTQPVENQEGLLRLDHRFSNAHSVQFNYMRVWGDEQFPDSDNGLNTVPNWLNRINEVAQTTSSVKHTWVATPSLMVESRFNFTFQTADRTNDGVGRDLSDFGAENFPISQEGARKYLPQVDIDDGPRTFGGWLSLFKQENFRFGSTLTWVKGRHNIKAGVELQRDRIRQLDDNPGTQFTFDGRFSASPSGFASDVPSENRFAFAWADFLMGRYAGDVEARGFLDYDLHNWLYSSFIQDQWQVTPKLTVFPGLRYDFFTAASEKNDKMVAFIEGNRSTVFPQAPVNLAFPGDPGVPAGFFETDFDNIAPRVNVAYDVFGDGRTAVRGGVGLYYSYSNFNPKLWPAESAPFRPAVIANDGQLRDPWLTSAFPTFDSPPVPLDNSEILNFEWPDLVSAIGFAEPFETPYAWQWNLSVEREMTEGVTLEVGYVGNRTNKLPQNLDLNFARFEEGANDSAENLQSRRPFEGYQRITIVTPIAKSWYDALQVSSRIRRGGFNVRVHYTLAKGFDTQSGDPTSPDIQGANPLDPLGEKGPNQRRHTLAVHYVYDIPFLREGTSLAHRILGDWQLSGFISARSGQPLNVTLGTDWNFDGQDDDRPDLMDTIEYPNAELEDGDIQWFAWTPQGEDKPPFFRPSGGTEHNTFGTLGRNALVGPSQWTADMALLKSFRVFRDARAQFRIEAFNIFNHPILSNPNTTFSSGNFGRITSRFSNRRFQLGLKLYF
jgi:hypothetical protein